jgi:hypothetical protein
MMNTDKRVLEAMRTMAWERAKGELRSMLETFWPEYDRLANKIPNNYEALSIEINKFIEAVEDNELMN